MKKRIGILGGTFDPVHNGHISIATAFLKSKIIDELWIMPAPDPPHKKTGLITEFDQRFELLQLVFKNWNGILISDLEDKLPKPSYSLRTIKNLKKEFPDKIFFLCLGSDSLEKIDTWYHYEDLSKECRFLVARRPGFNPDKVKSSIMKRCIFIDHNPIDVSSTQIRQFIKEGKNISALVPGKVLEHIKKKRLYL